MLDTGIPFFENGLSIHQFQAYPTVASNYEDHGTKVVTNNQAVFPSSRLPTTTLSGDLITFSYSVNSQWSCATFNGIVFEFLFTKSFTNVIDLDNSGYIITFDATHVNINCKCTRMTSSTVYRFQIVHSLALVTE